MIQFTGSVHQHYTHTKKNLTLLHETSRMRMVIFIIDLGAYYFHVICYLIFSTNSLKHKDIQNPHIWKKIKIIFFFLTNTIINTLVVVNNFLNYSLYLHDILKNSRATCPFTNNFPLTPDNPQTSLWAVCIGIFSPVQSCSSAVMSVDHVEKPGHCMWKDKFLFLFFKYYLFIVQQNSPFSPPLQWGDGRYLREGSFKSKITVCMARGR